MSAEYGGSCHCGAVAFRVRVRVHEALECDCSICTKKGFLHLIVPLEDFDLLRGEDALSEYRFGTRTARHTFCRVCGMHPFYTPRSHPDQIDVNVRCLDGDVADRFTVIAFHGREWEKNVESILD